jgi:hypothetical protein
MICHGGVTGPITPGSSGCCSGPLPFVEAELEPKPLSLICSKKEQPPAKKLRSSNMAIKLCNLFTVFP